MENRENQTIDYGRLADEVARRLADRAALTDLNALTLEHSAAPHPGHSFPRLPHMGPAGKQDRIRLDEGRLASALAECGMLPAAAQIAGAPAEVKLIAALLLDVGVELAHVGPSRRAAQYGFDNPFSADRRLDSIACRLGIDRDGLAAEVESAPLEMVAILLLVSEICAEGGGFAQGRAADSLPSLDPKEV